MGNLAMSASLGLDSFEVDPVELRQYGTENEDDLQTVIRAVYKQVLGNQHIMESQRLDSAEALLRNGSITVRDFVRAISQSTLYQSLFFNSSSQYRFIELNFKHLLGRPPQDQAEISEHVRIYNEQGYDAEINSYIDSDEYVQNFGDDIVPHPRSIATQVGLKNETFNRMFALLRGPATSDSSTSARLISSLASNLPTAIKAPSVGNGANYGNTGKRYSIAYSSSKASARIGRFSKQERTINFSQMNQTVQQIHKSGGKIISITELV